MKNIPRPVLIITIICLVLAPILLLNLVEFLRGGELWHWLWPYKPVWLPDPDRNQPAQTGRMLVVMLGVGVYVLMAAWAMRRKTARYALIVAFAGSVILPYAVTWLRYDDPFVELFNRTVSGVVTGPHLLASQIDWNNPDEWRDYVKVMDDFHILSVHMGQSPPGLVLFYGALNQVLEWIPPAADFLYARLLPNQCHNSNMLNYTHAEWASTWFGVLMPLWVALTIFPLYAVAKRLTGEANARPVALLWILIPTVAMMSPVWNLLYPVLCILAFWLMLVGLEKRRGEVYFVLSGFLVGLLIFANLSVVPVVMLFGFYALLHYIFHERGQHPVYRPVVVGLWYALGLCFIWLIYTPLTGTSPLDILQRAFGTHLELERPFLPWLYMHAWEWALLGSLPCVGLFLLAVVRWFTDFAAESKSRRIGNVLPVALFLTLVILLLSNTARGETGRVWLFFTPFAMLSAALWAKEVHSSQFTVLSAKNNADDSALSTQHSELNTQQSAKKHNAETQRDRDTEETPSQSSPAAPGDSGSFRGGQSLTQHSALSTRNFFIWLPVLIAQAALMLALATTWDTMFAPDIQPTPSPPTPYANAMPQDALFGDAFRLVGWHGEIKGDTLTLYLNMQSTRQLTTPYFFAALPVAPDGSTAPGFDWQPNATRYPTTCWQPNQVIGDTVAIPVPENAPEGDWWISVTAFADLDNPMETLTVTLPDGTTDRQIGLGPVRTGG